MNLQESAPVLVLGSRGYLGGKLLKSASGAFKALPVSRVETPEDLPRFAAQVRAALARMSGATLINCIGLRVGTADHLNLINASIPAVLAEVASDCGSHFIHIGSAAETVAPLPGVSLSAVAQALEYGVSKRVGSSACLEFPLTSVLRVYNLHGLPHQSDSGLHQICLAHSAFDKGENVSSLINTTRDYVDWQTVVTAVEEAVTIGPMGMREVCSGVGVSVSQILEAINDGPSRIITASLVPADLIGPVVGSDAWPISNVEDSLELAARLALEVAACASF
jgi:nucleoside-diphosphate-sugar epimerase